MHIGIFVTPTATTPSLVELAPAIEHRDFDSLWVPEHSHLPVAAQTPGREPAPRGYAHIFEPFVALAVAAAVTSRIRLGTGVCLLTQRDTIQTAKTVATLDHVSGGRVLFGVGGGWNRPEMENHGADYASRFRRLEEQVNALRRIWTHEEAEFHGRHVRFDPLWCWPKPLTAPHPPIYLGGESEHTLARIVRCADGWLPRMRDPDAVLAGAARLRALARAAGRAGDSIAISAFGVEPRAEALARLRDAGIERAIVRLPPGTLPEMLARLDGYAALIQG
jgi:probable F420-dependent oxidoreductase